MWSRICHAQDKRLVVGQVRTEFILKFVTPDGVAAGTIAFRVSSLNHETLDNSVEDQVVVVPIFGMSREVLNRFGAILRVQVEMYLSHRSEYDRLAGKYLGLRDDLAASSRSYLGLLAHLLIEHISA